MTRPSDTHSLTIGYVLWLFGFTGSHRFYYGKKWTGLLWACTGGLFLIGWLVDLFFMARFDREADERYADGPVDYTVAWLLGTFLGPLGVHHFYMGRILRGIVWLCTGGLLGVGWILDLFFMNEMVDAANRRAKGASYA